VAINSAAILQIINQPGLLPVLPVWKITTFNRINVILLVEGLLFWKYYWKSY